MTDRPILFSAPMVRALLAGLKTQTRRIVKGLIGEAHHAPHSPVLWISEDECVPLPSTDAVHCCPYGQPGDRLWVKERWRVHTWYEDDGDISVEYADGHTQLAHIDDEDLWLRLWVQSSDDAKKVYGERERYTWKKGKSPCRWRPSLFLPKCASRITLEITGVRVVRLQEISPSDAAAEGLSFDSARMDQWHVDGQCAAGDAVRCYAKLWESINGPGSWDANPWVWVVGFKRVIDAEKQHTEKSKP